MKQSALPSFFIGRDGHGFHAIETYPTACQDKKAVKALLRGRQRLDHPDKNDARVCAVVAYLFASERSFFEEPPHNVPRGEGWIWVPR